MTVEQFKKARSFIRRIEELETNIGVSKTIIEVINKYSKEQTDFPFVSTIDIDGNKINVSGEVSLKIYDVIIAHLNEELSLLKGELAKI